MGLGIGCSIPPPVLKCPCHIGIVLAKRFAKYDHKPQQRYTDTFDNIDRARDNIKWVVAKDDLITEKDGIQRMLRVVKKKTTASRTFGKSVGRVTVVYSTFDGLGKLPTRASDTTDSTFIPSELVCFVDKSLSFSQIHAAKCI